LAPTHKPSEKDMTICHMIALLLLALELFGHRHDRELRGPGTLSLNPRARSLYSDDVNPRTPWRALHGAAARSSSRASSTPKRPPAVRIQASAREGSRWQRRRQTARPPLHTYIHTHRRTQTRFYHNNNNDYTSPALVPIHFVLSRHILWTFTLSRFERGPQTRCRPATRCAGTRSELTNTPHCRSHCLRRSCIPQSWPQSWPAELACQVRGAPTGLFIDRTTASSRGCFSI
jgi:hypothetical protein